MAVFNHTKHKEMWLWLADHPGSRKRDWPGWGKRDWSVGLTYDCFACNAVFNIGGNCTAHCPLRWGAEHCCDDESPFAEWRVLTGRLRDGEVPPENMGRYVERIRNTALAIANLPLREIEGIEVI